MHDGVVSLIHNNDSASAPLDADWATRRTIGNKLVARYLYSYIDKSILIEQQRYQATGINTSV